MHILFCYSVRGKILLNISLVELATTRGISSDGRALALHARGGGTDARILQTRIYLKAFCFYFSVESVKVCISAKNTATCMTQPMHERGMGAPLGTDCKIILQCHPEPHTFPCLPEPHTFPCACKHEWDAWTGTWTLDPQIKSLMLYRLSYPGSVRKQIDMPLLFLKPFIVLLRNLII